ncbi:CDP-alcohol phosphatidyltransferase [uncultured Proteiniphilum sp.]|uniref:CDP-alcohol phosphatidyltransferase n=1 Tax=uncultured Proteiniphilum sp. TaxID=497637 RepID=UPI0026335056|nr:CDP-alcohol phosphatidyltransferase [uncultured Proteiniphilum sp.]
MKKNRREMAKSLRLISSDRRRTNMLREWEQKTIAYLVQKIPSCISSDGLTAIGFFGNVTVASGFVMGAFLNRYWLLLSLPGFLINWIGDSLDGRLAYYRNKPRKWYGFSLDVTVDWIGTFLIGLGYTLYAPGWWKYAGFFFVVLYGWEMITAQLRYKISGQYSIDSGIFGPTEVRLLLGTIITIEVFVPNSIQYLASAACIVLLISNLVEARNLLRLADERDKVDRDLKEEEYKKKRMENA